ncbi:hypothetical protein D7Y13_44040, partial [Corallococcus praedator]
MTAHRLAFPAMLGGSVALAFGPLFVRLAEVAPVASAFWRVALAAVPLAVIAAWQPHAARGLSRLTVAAIALAALCFAADLALWHLGIVRTTLANAALLSNAASFFLPLFGYLVARRWRAWCARYRGAKAPD